MSVPHPVTRDHRDVAENCLARFGEHGYPCDWSEKEEELAKTFLSRVKRMRDISVKNRERLFGFVDASLSVGMVEDCT